jgi:hypothetical protein
MGNNLYTLMTGLWPFYEEDRYTPVINMVKKRKRPYLDPRWRRRSYIEKQFVEIMVKMWRHSPEERPDIFAVVEFLKYTKRHAADSEAENSEDAEAIEDTEEAEAAEGTEDVEAVEDTDTSEEEEEADEAEEAVVHTDTYEEGEEVDEAGEAEETEISGADSNESRRALRRRNR